MVWKSHDALRQLRVGILLLRIVWGLGLWCMLLLLEVAG